MTSKLFLAFAILLPYSAGASEYATYACREEGSFQKVELEIYGHLAQIYGWRFLSTGITEKIDGTSYVLFEEQGSEHLSVLISDSEGYDRVRKAIVKDADSGSSKKLECRFDRRLR
jgi:hypothetical protein